MRPFSAGERIGRMGGVAKREYREGELVATWIGIGMALFAGVGVVIASVTDTPGLIGIGPAIGVAFGTSVGTALEARYRREGRLRPPTPAERRRLRIALWIGAALLVLGIAVAVLVLLSAR